MKSSMDAQQLDALKRRFASASAEKVLSWAADTFGDKASFGTGFGVEGCVMIHMIGTLQLPIDLFTLDTGLFFEQTYALWHRLEQRYGVTIRAVRSELSVDRQAEQHGPELWRRAPDECCRIRKVVPLAAALRGKQAWISAIRRDQTNVRGAADVVERENRFGLIKINPLLAWTLDQIWSFVAENDIPYNPMHDQGYPSIGCWPCTTAVAEGEDPRAGRWRGHVKTECGLHGRFVAAAGDDDQRGKLT